MSPLQPVNRKSPRAWPPWRRVWLCCALIIGFALLMWLGWRASAPKDAPPPPARAASPAVAILRAAPAQIARLEIKLSSGANYALVREKDRIYLADNPAYPLDPAEIATHFNAASSIQAQPLPRQGSGQSADAFFAQPLQVNIRLVNGEERRLTFGDRVRGSHPMDYLRVEGDAHLYWVDAELREALEKPLNALHPLPNIIPLPDQLQRIDFAGQSPFVLERLAQGFWHIAAPWRYPADAAALSQFANHLAGMRLALFVTDITDQTDLAAYGLAQPWRTVRMGARPSAAAGSPPAASAVLELQIGADVQKIGFYCRYGDSIYQASYASMGFLLDITPQSLASRLVLNLPADAIRTLQVTRGAQEDQYRIAQVERILPNNDLARDEAGNILYDPDIEKNGRSVEAQPVLTALRQLNALSADGLLPDDWTVQQTPTVVIRAAADTITQTVELLPFDALHSAIRVDGQALFYIKNEKLALPLLSPDGAQP